MNRITCAWRLVAVLLALIVWSPSVFAASCEKLAAGTGFHGKVLASSLVIDGRPPVPAEQWDTSPGMNVAGRPVARPLPRFCRVQLLLSSGAGSQIRSEVWLPLDHWNGRLLGLGNFGWGGVPAWGSMAAGLAEGYAVVGSDSGHDATASPGGEFALGHRAALDDYGGRATHLMTMAAKRLVRAWSGHAPLHTYFIGCSLGGLQALIEASRYPADYDGIVAGAPPNPLPAFNAAQIWPQALLAVNPAGKVSQSLLAGVAHAALAACASPVGTAQGFIEDPARCAFDPASLICPDPQSAPPGSVCLTRDQAEFLRRVHAGPTTGGPDGTPGRAIFPGPAVGSDNMLWPFVNGNEFRNAADLFRYAAFQDVQWSPLRFDWSRDAEAADRATRGMFTVAPDLDRFVAHGGRLLLYIGWDDYHDPRQLAGWQDAVIRHAGPRAQGAVRLFALPGVGHCQGGPGCDTFAKLGTIDRWVSTGHAPQRLIASKVDQGRVVRERLVCAWPKVARYDGHGAMDRADSFHCY